MAERISCLMVTRPGPERFELVRRSASCFLAQTYLERELVVVLDEGPAEWVERIKRYVTDLPARTILVQSERKRTLGALRNLAIATASGSVLCQWDDDDLSHPSRLQHQFDGMREINAVGAALQEFLHFSHASREMHWINFRTTPDGCHAGTIMFQRTVAARCPEEGPDSHGREDSAFLASLRREGSVALLSGAACLYVYIYHGHNLLAENRHQELAKRGLSRGLLTRKRPELLKAIAGFDLGDYPVKVMGFNGMAFEIGKTND